MYGNCNDSCFVLMNLQVTVGDAKHVIIDGFPGIGKRTMALALLRENFGLDILEVLYTTLLKCLVCIQ